MEHRSLITMVSCLMLLGCSESSETAQDAMVVYGLLDTEIFLYDQQLIGLPTGAQDISADCPLGGSVHLVGTTQQAEKASVDLSYTMTGCANTGSNYDLVFTGEIHLEGSFASNGYKALSSTSDELEVVGTVVADGETVDVDELCALAVTDRGQAGEASAVSGKWCERGVSF